MFFKSGKGTGLTEKAVSMSELASRINAVFASGKSREKLLDFHPVSSERGLRFMKIGGEGR